MLFLVILVMALVRGLMVYTLGALLAVLMWIVCLVLRWPVPSFVRWGMAAFLVGLHLMIFRVPAGTEGETLGDFYLAVGSPTTNTTGWEGLDFGTNLVVILAVLLALACTGLIISSIKGIFKGARAGAKAIGKAQAAAAAARQETPPV